MKRPTISSMLILILILSLLFMGNLQLLAQETFPSVDGGTSKIPEMLQRYGAFIPFFLGIVLIALRRKFFPDSEDKKK